MGMENRNRTMQSAAKVPIADLNECITCKLCRGYFIDATTIIECLHTFCRSCIIHYLETNKYCPVCDVQVHKTKPLLNVRPDKTLQDIVYKLVPRLFQNEIQRRKIYYDTHPEVQPTSFEESTTERYQYILTPEETISLTLSYSGCIDKPRYFRCPSAVSIAHIKKLICAKYELMEHHKVEVFYNQDCLNSSFSLMDIAYIYSWKGVEPMNFTFKIYEAKPKMVKFDAFEGDQQVLHSIGNIDTSNNNNWKEVQLRISESGEMSITGIQDASVLEILDGENYKSDVMVNKLNKLKDTPKSERGKCEEKEMEPKLLESDISKAKKLSENHMVSAKKELPELMLLGKTTGILSATVGENLAIKVTSGDLNCSADGAPSNKSNTPVTSVAFTSFDLARIEHNITTSARTLSGGKVVLTCQSLELPVSKPESFQASPLASIPVSMNCASLSSGSTTTVFSTINKTMCSTKSEESGSELEAKRVDQIANNTTTKSATANNVGKEANLLKRKSDDVSSPETPSKVPKPTILNHSIGLMNLSNNHPLKKHSKINRNGEHPKQNEVSDKSQSVTVNYVTVSAKVSVSETGSSKPILINKNLQPNRPGTPGVQKNASNKLPSTTLPCYIPKTTFNPVIVVPKLISSQPVSKGNVLTSSDSKTSGSNGKPEVLNSLLNARPLPPPPPAASFVPPHSSPPSSAAHFLNSVVAAAILKSTNSTCTPSLLTTSLAPLAPLPTTTTQSSKKVNAPIGYKTLRDPPKSWNSQIAKANMNVKAAAAATSSCMTSGPSNSSGGKYSGDSKSIRPAKFFKGRNMPRYLGNPASGVKPMYQVHVSPEKEKHRDQNKMEKSEIKKHSIVKIDPKTLKPISEKAPENTSLSNVSGSLSITAAQNQELRCTSTPGDLKINTSSVSIFNPLKLQSSPKSDRKSPKSPHSPKIKPANSTMPTPSSVMTPAMLSPTAPKRDKTSLTFTPPNPFVPNLTSPTLSPNQFVYPAGAPPGFPAYDPRVMAAYHSLWYGQRMAAAAAAGFPSALPGLGLGIGKNPFDVNLATGTTSPQQHSPRVSPKHSTAPRALTPTRGSNNGSATRTSPTTRKTKDSSAKSLETALEKLTQNKVKEMGKTALCKESSGKRAVGNSAEDEVPKSVAKEVSAGGTSDTAKPTVPIAKASLRDESLPSKKSPPPSAVPSSDIDQNIESESKQNPVCCGDTDSKGTDRNTTNELSKPAAILSDGKETDDSSKEKTMCSDKETTKGSSDAGNVTTPNGCTSDVLVEKDAVQVKK